MLEHGPEEGQIQHYFNEEEIRTILPEAQFRLLETRHNLEEKLTASAGFSPEAWTGRWVLTAEVLEGA